MVAIRRLLRPSFRWPALSLGLGRDIDLLVVSNFLWGIGSGFYSYLLPLYVAELGAEPAQIGLVLALTSVVQAIVYIPAGVLADCLGRKPLMLFGWSLGPAAAVVFGLASTWQQLIPAVVLLAAVAWCAPAYHSYIAAAAGPRDLPRAFTTMFVAVTVGATLTAPLGGWLGQVVGLRWLFAGAFAGYLASTLVVALLRPQSVPRRKAQGARGKQEEARGQVQVSGRSWVQGESNGTPIAGHSGSQSSAPGPQSPRRGGRLRLRWEALPEVWSGRLAATLALTAALMFTANLAQPLAPNWLADTYGFTPVDIGGFGAASALGGAALAIALGRLQQYRGPQWALAAAGLGLLAYVALLLGSVTWLLAAAAYVLRGVFSILSSLAVALVAGVLTGQAQEGGEGSPGGRSIGLGFALYNTASAVAVTLSTYAAGWLYGLAAPFPFVASAALLAPLLSVVWLVAPRIVRPPLHQLSM